MKIRMLMAHLVCAAFLALNFQSQSALAAEARIERAATAGGIIVKYRSEQTGANLAEGVRLADSATARRGIAVTYDRAGALGTHVLTFERALPVDEAQELADLIQANDPNIEYAEPDVIMHPTFVPNDTEYPYQWHYFESTGGINLPSAWDTSTGTGVVVAVLDTGYRAHADLAANIVGGYDFISNSSVAGDGNGRDSSALDPGDFCTSLGTNSSWHGTHVAGTVAAVTNNGTGVAGVAFGAKVLPVRVLGRCGGSSSDIADAIVWASGGTVSGVPANAYPARVLNLSLGQTASCGTTMQNAINSARSRNSVVVVSAGNDNQDAVNASPANCNGVITVAATNRSGGRAFFHPPRASNYGSVVEIAAPGGEVVSASSNGVLSTLNTGVTTPGIDSYSYYQGTSMAAPHVAGVAALVLSVNPGLTPDGVLAILQSTARSFPGVCSQCGSGIVDAAASVTAALPVPDTLTVTVGSDGVANSGYSHWGSIGSLSPNTTSTGKIYRAILDWEDYWTLQSGSVLQVCGFSSNPSSNWLGSISLGATTKLAAQATYLYQSSGPYTGCANWSWYDGRLGMYSGQVQVTISHQ